MGEKGVLTWAHCRLCPFMGACHRSWEFIGACLRFVSGRCRLCGVIPFHSWKVVVCGCRFSSFIGKERAVVMCHAWSLAINVACPACHVSSFVVVLHPLMGSHLPWVQVLVVNWWREGGHHVSWMIVGCRRGTPRFGGGAVCRRCRCRCCCCCCRGYYCHHQHGHYCCCCCCHHRGCQHWCQSRLLCCGGGCENGNKCVTCHT